MGRGRCSGVVLQIAVVEVPFLQVAFGTASAGLGPLGRLRAPSASVVLWFDEIRKVMLRAMPSTRRPPVPNR